MERECVPGFDWVPELGFIESTNMAWLMREVGVDSYRALHKWSVQNREQFWQRVIHRLDIRFREPFSKTLDLTAGPKNPRWLVGARLNIVESCLNNPPDFRAIVFQEEGGEIQSMTAGELGDLVDRISANLLRLGFKAGDKLAIVMPMTAEAVAIYLGIIKIGCVAVGIADSFQSKELAARLGLCQARAVFTQDFILRDKKSLPLYRKLVEANAPVSIVLPAKGGPGVPLRPGDHEWNSFLTGHRGSDTAMQSAEDCLTVLFSSGTTGQPKAIPWTQATPIKCAMDAHFHQNVQPGDVLVWPTNMGWMMGPWLVFAALLNHATIGLYYGAPTGREFGCFVEAAKTSMLGVIPSFVKSWRNSNCMEHVNWSSIKVISSTGECSNADDMRWLMALAGQKPVIEYCGGTEIGGAYITGSVTEPCLSGAFSTPALGLDFAILDAKGHSSDEGELFIIPPSIGLSTTLLNQDHHEIYYEGTPETHSGQILRRHGDHMQRLANGYICGLGRTDDTMNLGGIKVSSAEIEDVLQSLSEVDEVAAVAVAPCDGPSLLVVYAVGVNGRIADTRQLLTSMQKAIREKLNPLFKIHELVSADQLPRTASNKIARRVLRERWLADRLRQVGPGGVPGRGRGDERMSVT